MATLSEKQLRFLRGKAHALKPVVLLGNKGLTDNVVAETRQALRDHELIAGHAHRSRGRAVPRGGADSETGAAGRSGVAHRDDFIAARAAGGGHLDDVAHELGDQRARDRRADRNATCADVGLVLADDLVGHDGAFVLVLELDRGAEHDPPLSVSCATSITSAVDKRDSISLMRPFDETLLFARRVVFGVLRQVAMRARLGDRLDDVRAASDFSRLSSVRSSSAPRSVIGERFMCPSPRRWIGLAESHLRDFPRIGSTPGTC
jgi:hypothetical protein